ncbi:hypothetical protein ACOMHN_055064 [Nucella lapillus]
MDSMDLSVSNTTVSALENMDKHRIQKAERAAQATAVKLRRVCRVQRQRDLTRQEDQEGQTYGAGMQEC